MIRQKTFYHKVQNTSQDNDIDRKLPNRYDNVFASLRKLNMLNKKNNAHNHIVTWTVDSMIQSNGNNRFVTVYGTLTDTCRKNTNQKKFANGTL